MAPFVSSLSDHPGISPFEHGYGCDPMANGMQRGQLPRARRAGLTGAPRLRATPQRYVARHRLPNPVRTA
jgi:hypothetical protein